MISTLTAGSATEVIVSVALPSDTPVMIPSSSTVNTVEDDVEKVTSSFDVYPTSCVSPAVITIVEVVASSVMRFRTVTVISKVTSSLEIDPTVMVATPSVIAVILPSSSTVTISLFDEINVNPFLSVDSTGSVSVSPSLRLTSLRPSMVIFPVQLARNKASTRKNKLVVIFFIPHFLSVQASQDY